MDAFAVGQVNVTNLKKFGNGLVSLLLQGLSGYGLPSSHTVGSPILASTMILLRFITLTLAPLLTLTSYLNGGIPRLLFPP